MSKKALLGKLEEMGYTALEYNKGRFSLYDNNTKGKRSNYQYVGTFTLTPNYTHYVFNGERFDDALLMLDCMVAFNESLPFSPEVYDPTYRTHCGVEFAVGDYMEKLGFEAYWNGHADSCCYRYRNSLSGRVDYDIAVSVKDDTTEGTVRLTLMEARWMEAPFTDIESAIGAINTLLSTSLSYNSITTTTLMNLLSEQRSSEFFEKTFSWANFRVITEDAKAKTIAFLETELKKLKGE